MRLLGYALPISLLILRKKKKKKNPAVLESMASAVLWNFLPQSVRDLQSVETFKRKLKEHLSFTDLHGTLNFYCYLYFI